ncbi:MAG: DUF3592 domain-containing protein [Lachnospiraceae bacterium]|nr:DUF3592 domain-containing protein [Lachnospiraceae bacterium]
MSGNGKNKVSDAILSIVFLMWFVASIVLLIYFAKTGKTALTLAVFGQYFLVFGIIGLVSTISNNGFKLRCLPILLFPLVGLGGIAGGIIIQYGSEEFKKRCTDAVPMIFIVLFIVIGVFLIIAGLYSSLFLKLTCTEYVNAECVEVKKQYTSNHYETYCPVYSFSYNGQNYMVCNDIYTNRFIPAVGQSYEVYINPNNPMKIYEPLRSMHTGLYMAILGVFIVCFMGFVLYMMNK